MSLLLNLVPWWGRALAVLALVLACMAFGAAKMHAHDEKRYDALQKEYSDFQAGVKAKGEQADRDRVAKEKADKERKEKADHENATTIAALNDDIKRLRNQRASSSFLPAAAPGSKRPDVACFKRSELESALQRFDAGTSDIVAEGDGSRVNLDTAKKWARP